MSNKIPMPDNTGILYLNLVVCPLSKWRMTERGALTESKKLSTVMNSCKHFLLFWLISTSLVAGAQTKNGIIKIYAFSAEHLPGNIPVDPSGKVSLNRGPDISNTIYIETTGQPILWTAAWKNGKAFSIMVTPVESPVAVGISKSDRTTIVLSAASGNRLLRLDLLPAQGKTRPPQKIGQGKILLLGKYRRKTITQTISNQIELLVRPSE